MGVFKSSVKNVVGIDIGSKFIKMVCVQLDGKGGVKVLRWASIEHPANLGVKVNKYIKMCKNKVKVRGANTSICYSDGNTLIKEFSFPDMGDKDLKNNIELEISEYISGDIKDYTISFKIISKESGSIRVLAVAALTEGLEGSERLVVSSGLRVKYMDVEPNAISKVLKGVLDNRGGSCVVNIGDKYTNISIFDENDYIAHSVEESGDDRSNLIQRLTQVIEYFYRKRPSNAVNKIYLIGGAVGDSGLKDRVESGTGIATYVLDFKMMSERYIIPNHFPIATYCLALGAAIREDMQ